MSTEEDIVIDIKRAETNIDCDLNMKDYTKLVYYIFVGIVSILIFYGMSMAFVLLIQTLIDQYLGKSTEIDDILFMCLIYTIFTCIWVGITYILNYIYGEIKIAKLSVAIYWMLMLALLIYEYKYRSGIENVKHIAQILSILVLILITIVMITIIAFVCYHKIGSINKSSFSESIPLMLEQKTYYA